MTSVQLMFAVGTRGHERDNKKAVKERRFSGHTPVGRGRQSYLLRPHIWGGSEWTNGQSCSRTHRNEGLLSWADPGHMICAIISFCLDCLNSTDSQKIHALLQNSNWNYAKSLALLSCFTVAFDYTIDYERIIFKWYVEPIDLGCSMWTMIKH